VEPRCSFWIAECGKPDQTLGSGEVELRPHPRFRHHLVQTRQHRGNGRRPKNLRRTKGLEDGPKVGAIRPRRIKHMHLFQHLGWVSGFGEHVC
jgi:hypothetical protein